MNKKKLDKRVPEIYCAISMLVRQEAQIEKIVSRLTEIGIKEIKVCKSRSEPVISLDFAIVKNERFWYLDDALTKMFSRIKRIDQLKEIVNEYKGNMRIDIAFYQHGTYPALEFCGSNMEKIRFLEADISIDAY